MTGLGELVDGLAEETGFSGVVGVDRGDDVMLRHAYGLADRRHGIAMRTDSQLGIASGSKAFTAVAVMSLVQDGVLALSTTARTHLGDDLPLIDDAVTVEQLLAHRSGIGDYLAEDDWDAADYVLPVPVQQLATTEQFLAVLDGYPMAFTPGERFGYCNGGYVVLALIAERASGVSYHDLVRQRVCAPAGMADTDFLRSDELPARAALGYVEVGGHWRTNVFHLPVLATGDGGIYTTVDDVHRFWSALFAGRILPSDAVAELVRPRSEVPAESFRYGMGFGMHLTRDIFGIVGEDTGASFRSVHDPASGTTHTVIGPTAEDAWKLTKALDTALGLQ